MRGNGFTIAFPDGWRITHGDRGLAARRGAYLVSVTRFRLQRRYVSSEFGVATAQLDRVADQLAARSGGRVTQRQTLTVGGERARAYTVSGRADTRIGFVLHGPSEFQLLCSGPAGSAAGGPDGACALLFGSFRLG